MRIFFFIYLFIFNPIFSLSQNVSNAYRESVAFASIDKVPVFPGCEKLEEHLHKSCMQNEIKKHVAQNFNVKLANSLGLEPGKIRVYVLFLINKEGLVADVKARAPHKELEKEGIRVLRLLPKMRPGLQQGKPIGVKYTMPITLQVDKPKKKK